MALESLIVNLSDAENRGGDSGLGNLLERVAYGAALWQNDEILRGSCIPPSLSGIQNAERDLQSRASRATLRFSSGTGPLSHFSIQAEVHGGRTQSAGAEFWGQSLAHRGLRDAGDLYGGAGHGDRVGRASVYCRFSVCLERRSDLGADQLSGGQRGDFAGQQLVFAAIWAQAVPDYLRNHLHHRFFLLRSGTD